MDCSTVSKILNDITSTSDINECDTENGGCGQMCSNTNGSYVCDCNVGYGLAEDSRACIGEQLVIYILYIRH